MFEAVRGKRAVKFMGFKREGRLPGIRNNLWVIPTADGVCDGLNRMLAGYHKPYWIDAVAVLDEACRSLTATGRDGFARIVQGLAANPNAAGVLIVAAAGDEPYAWSLMQKISSGGAAAGAHVRSLIIGEPDASGLGGAFGVMLDELAAVASRTRVGFKISNLRVGLVAGNDGAEPAHCLASCFSGWLEERGGSVIRPDDGPRQSSCIALASQGAQMIVTGPGGVLSAGAVPLVTISDCGPGDPEVAGGGLARFTEYVLRVASGEKPPSERKIKSAVPWGTAD
jgi:altronate dehydratase